MPIDPSIAMGVRPIQIADPMEQYGRVMQIQAAQNQNRLADLMFAEKEREASESNALSQLYKGAVGADGKIDRAKLFTSAAEGGLGAKLPALQKTFADADKTEAETAHKQIETATKQMAMAGQVFGYVRNNPTVENAHAAIDYLTERGIYKPDRAAAMKAAAAANPASIQGLAERAYTGALSAKDQLAQFQTRNTGGTTDTISIDPVTNQAKVINSVKNTQSPDSAASVAATIRGQNMVDARARERLQVDAQNGGKPPAGYRWAPDGQSLMPIPGGPAEKDSGGTEGERNAAGYGLRMAEAEKIIGAVTATNPAAQKPGMVEKLAGPGVITNVMSSNDRQKYRQAQEDWVRAKLRKESGAVIGAEEMESEIRTYFPQPAEGEAAIAQKAQARKVAMDAMRISSGKAGKAIDSGSGPTGPKVGTVEAGYQYIGGDPANPKSWKKAQ